MNIGIAGYMGAGKSAFARLLAGDKGVIINADEVAKDMMRAEPHIDQKLIKAFGSGIVIDSAISSEALGKLAFRSIGNLVKLNRIVHPPLLKKLEALCLGNGASLRILDAALIPLWNIEQWFDLVVWISASPDIRLRRMLKERSIDEGQLRRRMALQEELFREPTSGRWQIVTNESSLKELNALAEKCRSSF
jgi:dephospho-CoA kinase